MSAAAAAANNGEGGSGLSLGWRQGEEGLAGRVIGPWEPLLDWKDIKGKKRKKGKMLGLIYVPSKNFPEGFIV